MIQTAEGALNETTFYSTTYERASSSGCHRYNNFRMIAKLLADEMVALKDEI